MRATGPVEYQNSCYMEQIIGIKFSKRQQVLRAAQDAWGGGRGVGSPKSCHEQGRGAQGGRLKPMTTSHPALGGRPRWPMINHEATYGRLGEAGARVYLQGHLRGKVGPE